MALKFTSSGLVFVLLLAHTGPIKAAEQTADSALRTRLLILDRADLERTKQKTRNGDPAVTLAARKLRGDADRALSSANYSVTHKTLSPPSGNKHDYTSLAPYWWPSPNTPSGLPYIRRDGEVNPERDQTSDRKRLDNMIQTVKTLGIAYFFFENEIYASRAAELLRIWFLNDATKMNPHLKYAQSVPGRSEGRGAGIIETHDLPAMLDAVALLGESQAWTKTNQHQLQLWFIGYLQWLLESPQGREEAKAKNNHGSWYDVQVASYALFTGQDQLAKTVLAAFDANRMATQIEADGRQSHELARTRAWHYSIFNLQALFNAAAIADRVGVDMWNSGTNNRSMRKAIDWLIPFATAERKWPYKETSAFEPQKLAPLLRIAAIRYRNPAYERAITKLPNIIGDERWQLLYAKVAEPK